MIEAAVAQGPHPTASTPEALEVFKEHIKYQLWTLTDVPKWLKFNVFKMLRGKQLALRQ